MEENHVHVVSLCCNPEMQERFLAAGNAHLTLVKGFSPEGAAIIGDKEGMQDLPSLPEGTLLFLLEGENQLSIFSLEWINRAENIFFPPFGHEAILGHIAFLLGDKNSEPSREWLKRQVRESLCTLHIPPRLLGHAYLAEGIEYLFSQPYPRSTRLLQKIYRQIGERHSTSPVMVDRAIRHGIESCWKKASPSQLKSLLGYDPHDLLGMPTNSEFLYALYEHLRSLLTPGYGKEAFFQQLHRLSPSHDFLLPE